MGVALLSVYHKKGIVDFAKALIELGWEIIASGGTAKTLHAAGVDVRDVASLVGGGAILGHRVVTLSREIHAGLLAKDTTEDRQELEKLGIPRIDLVCVDLYPLQEEIQNSGSTRESVIEKTDIGGPTMLRSAAKGRRVVICDPADRPLAIEWLKAGQPGKDEFITHLVAKAERVVAEYCLASARYHSERENEGFIGRRVLTCKYGENAWQTPAALYSKSTDDPLALDRFEVIQGTAPSYNNLCDLDRLLQTVTHIAAGFDVNRSWIPRIAVGVKHGNPCGAAFSDEPQDAIGKMVAGDPRALFGGLVMTNFPIEEKAAEKLISLFVLPGQQRLWDGIIAPEFTTKARDLLKRKNDKCRLLINPALANLNKESLDYARRMRPVRGGFLCQHNYTFVLDFSDSELVKPKELVLPEEKEDDLILAWAIGSTSNSNTITLVKNRHLIGNGVGQQDRVSCCQLAIKRACDAFHSLGRTVAYSDSFFPFTDGPQVLAEAGIDAILASSGSVKDDEVIKFCKEKSIALYLVPDKKGRGFFGH